jgi:hypothetical protein|tara:strand:+ start:135 stop:539 length:405 start_codon:yes stop_codon:yes gene_type:complete
VAYVEFVNHSMPEIKEAMHCPKLNAVIERALELPALIKALRVWDEYTEGNKQRRLKEERTRSLVEVAIALDREHKEIRKENKKKGIENKEEEEDDIGGIGDESKRQLVWRLNKTATLLIENVGKGNFPQHNVRG